MSEQELYETFSSNSLYYQSTSRAYIKEVIGLSRCDYLIGGASSGTAAALVMNGGAYDDIYILEDARKVKRY